MRVAGVTAALKPNDDDGAPALLGIEHSARGRRWVERLDPTREMAAMAIAQAQGLPELLGRVLAARGAEPNTVEAFLDPSLRTLLPDPTRLQDMARAAERFANAIRAGEKIAVFGDYDVDGASSVALIERFLRAHGQTCATYIPDRLREGYGPSAAALTGLAEEGASLILTVDCGTTSEAAIVAANAAGVEVIIIDHHQADEALPPAFAVVNPNRQDDLSGQGHLAAAGVVFLFLVATLGVLRRDSFYDGKSEPNLLGLLDLVALATVCDVVPLKAVNRAFVAQGLKVLRHRKNAGLRALADTSRLDEAPTTYSLGFVLGPRINAGGRVGDSGLGARLLASDDEVEARGIAEKLEALNTERKAIEETMLDEAFAHAEASLEATPDQPLLFLGAEGWHKGLIGLVAGRIADRFQRPTFVMAFEPDGTATGSARSLPSVDLGEVVRLAAQEGLFIKGGGHAMAAGFTLDRAKHDAALAFLQSHLAQAVVKATATRQLAIDGALSARGATMELTELLDRAGPYGAGHPQPRFVFPAHRVTRLRRMGQTQAHLRCTLVAPDGGRIDAVAFRIGGTPIADLFAQKEGMPLHVAGHLSRSSWQGRDRVELIIEDAATPCGDGP
jgi:single-stranded-DNA-specific exonuclease